MRTERRLQWKAVLWNATRNTLYGFPALYLMMFMPALFLDAWTLANFVHWAPSALKLTAVFMPFGFMISVLAQWVCARQQ